MDFSLSAPTDWDVVVCVKLAWLSPGMTDKTPSGALFIAFSGTGLLEFVSLMDWLGFLHGHGCGFFTRIFWCGFLDADFWVRIFGCGFWGADFFADFVMACADFGVRIFSADFFGCFPAEKGVKKSHQKIPPKNPHQRSSPRNVSSQYTTTLLLARHSRCPQGVWVQMHLVE